jgi:hypothetical protein
MTADYESTEEFQGATFHDVSLRGATFRDCDLSGVRITSSFVDDLWIRGFDGETGRIVVDDVDVTAYVAGELDRRYPERVQLRAVESIEDYRALWATLDGLWADTIARAGELPEARLHERINDEWSFVETLRHMVFGIDVWVGRVLRGEDRPWHPIGLPPTDTPAAAAARKGLDIDARPSFAEAVAVYAERRAMVSEVFASVSDLAETRTAVFGEDAEPETPTVGNCLQVILHEHCEHRRFAERDLAA